jgi:hypothetical protein
LPFSGLFDVIVLSSIAQSGSCTGRGCRVNDLGVRK